MVKWSHLMTSDISNAHLYNVFVWGGLLLLLLLHCKQLVDETASTTKKKKGFWSPMLLLFLYSRESLSFFYVKCMHSTCIDS